MDRLLSVGDLIDRGDGSHRCARFLAQPYVHAVRGNHEDMLLDLYKDGEPVPAVLMFAARSNGFGWWLPVRLVAHPGLTPEQEELIRFEYFNGTSARVETCRGALVGYFIQDMRAALDPGKQRPPDYQLAVANDKEVSRWLFPG